MDMLLAICRFAGACTGFIFAPFLDRTVLVVSGVILEAYSKNPSTSLLVGCECTRNVVLLTLYLAVCRRAFVLSAQWKWLVLGIFLGQTLLFAKYLLHDVPNIILSV